MSNSSAQSPPSTPQNDNSSSSSMSLSENSKQRDNKAIDSVSPDLAAPSNSSESSEESHLPSATSLEARSRSSSSEPEFDPDDPILLAHIKQSDYVYETVLRHMDWSGQYSDYPLKDFKAGYFLQPGAPAAQFHIPGLADPVPARYWPDEGPLVPASAVWIDNESQEKELEVWAAKQGKNGRLCPEVYMVGEERVGGWILMMDP